MPIIGEPFKNIVMDIVGPLPRSRSGNRYVLVICDYATWYPEAIALRRIDAEHVAEELIKVFSRVGVPPRDTHQSRKQLYFPVAG